MSDLTALAMTLTLALVAVAGYRGRMVLQPNRPAVAAYLAGAVVWGVALVWVWAAWAGASTGSDLCEVHGCESVVDSLDDSATNLPGDVLLSQDWVDLP